MAKLTTDFRAFWFGTGASVPAGWTRQNIGTTARFLQGAAASVEAGGTGGATTHTHTFTDHTHTGVSHTHSVSGSSITHSTTGTTPITGGAAGSIWSQVTHSHAGANSTGTIIVYNNKTGMVTNASTSGNTTPPYIEALFIAPNAGGGELPASACCLFNSATPPTGFSKCDGVGGTPNVDTKFIRVARNATADGGATGGTTAAHLHAVASHTHTVNSHVHSGCASADASASNSGFVGTTEPNTGAPLAHGYDLDSTLSTINAATFNTDNSNTSIEPAHTKLACIQNTSGADALPVGVIVAYTGTLAALAALTDWDLCDGTGGTPDLRGQWVKSQFTSVGTTGGSNIHDHGSSHTHTENAHTHTLTEADIVNRRIQNTAGTSLREAIGDQHENEHTWTIANATATINSTSLTTASADHRDPYLTVQWVQYLGSAERIVSLGGTVLHSNRVVLAG